MDNSTSLIFWFSGTGNSLYAAKRLSSELGGVPLAQIACDAAVAPVGGAGAKVGFVFPSYYGNLPRMVRSFVEKLEILPETYIFAIVTMGAVGQGSVYQFEKALAAKGLKLSYGRGVNMPGNYVVMYNPADPASFGKSMEKIRAKISECAADISAGKQNVKKIAFSTNKLYKNVNKLDSGYFAGAACKSCGLCVKICPAKNIILDGGRPKWQRRCEQCVACISWCPNKAVEYGVRTQKRRRYRNPEIDASELVRKA